MRLARRVFGALLIGLVVLCSEIDAAQFTLTWSDNSTNETGFRIERSTNGSTFAEVATVGANTVSYVDTGLPNSTTYWYRVRAYNAAGNSGYSNVATGTTPPLLSNNAPTISNIANRSIYAGGTTGVVPFTIGDAETSASALTVSVASSNTTLLPVSGIVLAGAGALRTIAATPALGRTGSATVTVTVSDGSLSTSDTFVVTVNAVGTGAVIATQPQAATLTPGSSLTLSVGVQATGTITYQWYFNDTAIAGATNASYTIPVAQRFNAGAYHVVVTAGGVSISSSAAVVSAGSATTSGSLVNLSSRASVLTGDSLLIPGFVVTGTGSKRLLVRMVGPGLTQFGLTGVIADPQIVLKRQLTSGAVDVASNLDWSDSGASALQQAFTAVGAFGLAAGSGDAAMVADLTPGSYSVLATDEQSGRTGLALVELYDADATSGGTGSARIVNMSTRGYLGTGNSVMITGFVIADGPVNMLIRTVGPGLSQFGVSGVVANPTMQLVRRVDGADELLVENDDWSTSPDASYTAQLASSLSAFPLASGSRDAAVVATLPPGLYTLVSRGVGSTTGIALVELYVAP